MAKRVGNRKASDYLQIAECGGVGLGQHSLSYAQESRGFVRKCGAGHIVQRAMQPCHIGVLVPSMALDCEDFGNCRSLVSRQFVWIRGGRGVWSVRDAWKSLGHLVNTIGSRTMTKNEETCLGADSQLQTRCISDMVDSV